MFLRDWGRFLRAVHAGRGCLDDDGVRARSEPKRRRPPGEFIAHGGRERKPRRGGRSAAIGVSGKAARQIPKGLSLRAGGLAIDRAIPKGHRGPVCAALPLPPRKASGSARCLCSLMGFQAQPPPGTHNRCRGPIGDGQVLRQILLRAARVFAIRGRLDTERSDKRTLLRRTNTTETTGATGRRGERQDIVGKRWSGTLREIPQSTGNRR